MLNEKKQQRLNELDQSEFDDLIDDIADINKLLPQLLEVDYRLFEVDQRYSYDIEPVNDSSQPDAGKTDHGNPTTSDINTSDTATTDSNTNPDDNVSEMEPDPLAMEFLYYMVMLDSLLDYYPLKELPLYLEIMADAMDDCDLWNFPVEQEMFSQDQVDDLNDCIHYIQDELKHPDAVRKLKNIRRQQVNQKKSIRNYIDQLFHRFARLEVIRLDLGYQQGMNISYSELIRHREQLTRYLREKHDGNAHVGFIWKLEYGLKKGYHFHMMIFMDGSRVQQSILHGMMIGKHWNTAITNGLGTSFNCNGKMREYRDCGIGRVDYYDVSKTNSLFRASDYLTKHDPYVEIMQCVESDQAWRNGNVSLSRQIQNGRVFGKGELPRLESRGRPRHYLNE
jgi:hypothetical protein